MPSTRFDIDENNLVEVFRVNFNELRGRSPKLTLRRRPSFRLTDGSNRPLRLRSVQGATFGADGRFYVASSHDKDGGIHVFPGAARDRRDRLAVDRTGDVERLSLRTINPLAVDEDFLRRNLAGAYLVDCGLI